MKITKKMFDTVMEGISSNLTGTAEHDVPYLKQQIDAYRRHPLGREIKRACGKIMWEVMPDERKPELAGIIEGRELDAWPALKDAIRNLRAGDKGRALKIIEPAARAYDKMIAQGWGRGDERNALFDFRSPIDEAVWRAHNNDERAVRYSIEPISQVFYVQALALYGLRRHREALSTLGTALRWNPVNCAIRFEIIANYKQLEDYRSFEQAVDDAHRFAVTAEEMALFHRCKGHALVERESFQLAAAHYVCSLRYERNRLALSELAYIKAKSGKNLDSMTREDAVGVLENAGEAIGADSKTLSALNDALRDACHKEDYDTAIQATFNLYRLTGNKENAAMTRQLMAIQKEVEKAAKLREDTHSISWL